MLFRKLMVRCTAIAAVCLVLSLAPLANAQTSKEVLKHVPDDAWAVVTLKSLSNLDAKVAKLDSVLQMGIPAPAGMAMMTMPALAANVDMTKPMAIIVMDVQKYGQMSPNEAFVLLVPAKDPKVMLETLAPPAETPTAETGEGGDAAAEKKVEAEDGVVKVSMMGQTGWAVVKDKNVLLGQSKECVKAVAKPKTTLAKVFDESRSKAMDNADLYISVAAGLVFEQFKDQDMPILQVTMAASDPSGQTVKSVEKTLSETKGFDIAAVIDDKGVSLQFLVAPKPGSDFEKLLKDTKNLDTSLLSRLPREKYLFCFGAAAQYSEHAEKFGGQGMFSQMVKSMGVTNLDEEATKTLDKELLKMQKEGGPSAFTISYLPDGKEGIFGVTMVSKPRSAKGMVESFRKIYETIWKVTDDEDVATLKENITHTPDAETIAGNKVDTLTLKMGEVADMLELQEEELDQIRKVLGEEITLRFGAVGDHFVLTMGGGKTRYEQVAKNLDKGSGLDTDVGIKAVGGMLPSPRAQEMYFAADNIVECVKGFTKAIGEEDPIPGDIPRVDAPVAISVAQQGSTMKMDVVVPMKLIKAGKEFYDKQSQAAMEDFESDVDDMEMDMDDDAGTDDEGGDDM